MILSLLIIITNSLTNQSSINYSAEFMSYDWISKTVILIDSAFVEFDEINLQGDTIFYYPEEKIVEVKGNMQLTQGNEIIFGDKLIFNINTKQGIVNEGRTEIPEGFFTGDTVWQVEDNIWHVVNGTFTTCDLENPHYHFWGNKMIVEHNGMLISEPLILYIGNVPVFALPWWFFPIKKGRHSGFLFPSIGNSSTDGRYVKKLAYYWVINDYSDATFSLDILEKKGVRFNISGLYIIKPFLSGNLNASYIRETNTGIERWRISGDHRHQLNNTTQLFGRVDWQSDKKYRVDYGDDVLVDLNKQTSSYLTFSKRWSFLILQILLLRQENILNNQVTLKIPELTYSLPSRKLASNGLFSQLYYSLSGKFLTKSYSDSIINYRLYENSNSISFQNPLTVFKYIKLNPSLRASYFINKSDTTGNYFYTRNWNFQTSVSTYIYGLSNWGFWNIRRFRHVVNPTITYKYSPSSISGYFGDTSYIYSNNDNYSLFNFALNQSIQIKWKTEEEDRKYEIFSTSASIAYDLKKDDERFSNLYLNFNIKPINNFTISSSYQYSPYTWERLSRSYSVSANFSGLLSEDLYYNNKAYNWFTNLSYTFSENPTFKNQQIWGNISLNPTDNWRVSYAARWDLEENHMVNQTLSLYRDLHCWEMFLSWQKFGDRWSYSFTIRIKDINDIRITKNMIRFLVPKI